MPLGKLWPNRRGVTRTCGVVSISPDAGYFRSSPMSGHFRCPSACLKGAKKRHAKFHSWLRRPVPNDGKRPLRLQLRKGCVDVFFDQTGMASIDACLRAELAQQIVAIVRSSEKRKMKRPEATLRERNNFACVVLNLHEAIPILREVP
jgi:hypothetical protein